jgi:MFS family permease
LLLIQFFNQVYIHYSVSSNFHHFLPYYDIHRLMLFQFLSKELGVKSGGTFWTRVTLTAQTVAMIVMLPYWGKLADKYGRKIMIIRAEICAAIIYLGMSYCQTLWQLLLLRLLNGGLTRFIPASINLISVLAIYIHSFVPAAPT